jgi:hypothetical protein
MKRERFVQVVEEALDTFQENFVAASATSLCWWRTCRRTSQPPKSDSRGSYFWVFSMACPRPRRAFSNYRWGLTKLYQKNIEAVCSSEPEIREQIRRTIIHELGHYFGMTEEQLKDV